MRWFMSYVYSMRGSRQRWYGCLTYDSTEHPVKMIKRWNDREIERYKKAKDTVGMYTVKWFVLLSFYNLPMADQVPEINYAMD